jgi:hypothetical protein
MLGTKPLRITLAVLSGFLLAVLCILIQWERGERIVPGVIVGAVLTIGMLRLPDRTSGFWIGILSLSLVGMLGFVQAGASGPHTVSEVLLTLGLLACYAGFVVIHVRVKKEVAKSKGGHCCPPF